MIVATEFEAALTRACVEEIARAPMDADRCTQITMGLARCLAETIAILLSGHPVGTAEVAQSVVDALPGLVEKRAALMRDLQNAPTGRGH